MAIKSIGSALGGSVSALRWVVNAYTIGFAAFILTAGALGDRIGARRVVVAGFVLFMVASVVCGLAPDLGVLIGAWAVQGVGAAVLVPSSLTLLNHAYTEPGARAHAVGLWLAGASLALSGGRPGRDPPGAAVRERDLPVARPWRGRRWPAARRADADRAGGGHDRGRLPGVRLAAGARRVCAGLRWQRCS